MARRSTASKRSAAARTRRARTAAPASPGPGVGDDLSLEQAKDILIAQRQQVERCRQMFFRLASVRGADLVAYQGKSWDEATNYINAEMAGLDQALSQLVPTPPAEPVAG